MGQQLAQLSPRLLVLRLRSTGRSRKLHHHSRAEAARARSDDERGAIELGDFIDDGKSETAAMSA